MPEIFGKTDIDTSQAQGSVLLHATLTLSSLFLHTFLSFLLLTNSSLDQKNSESCNGLID
jgi:hypothetical protein